MKIFLNGFWYHFLKFFNIFSEYKENFVIVDRIVEAISHKIESYYGNDNKTAFVFTSDHGMTDWGKIIVVQIFKNIHILLIKGSHGSSDDVERITPFLAWGAGIKRNIFK